MEKVFLVRANDALEAYLIEAILKKNDISCDIEIIKSESAKKSKKIPDIVNVLVLNENYEEALKLIDVIKEERKLNKANEDEEKLFTKKQLVFASTITVLFLVIVIWVVAAALN